jgi:multicomponent K+:H+ antiporter subunit E
VVTLAAIVTMTPGTLSVDYSVDNTEDSGTLLVHALHLDDSAALIESIRSRYEAPLRIIFGEEDV